MKIIIKIGLLLTVLGAISTTVFGFVASDALQEEIDLTEVVYTYDKDRFEKINLSFDNNPIKIQKSETDEITIRFSYDKYETIAEDKSETELSLSLTSKWYQRVFMGPNIFNTVNMFKNRTVYVSLPDEAYNIYAKTSNGEITVTELTLGSVVLKTSNGTVKVTNLDANSLTASSSNGTINLKNITAPLIEGTTSNGDILLDNNTSANLQLNTSNGNIVLKVVGNFADYRVQTATSLGKVKINNQTYGNDIYNQDKTPSISAKTSNGNINIEFLLD